MGLVHSHSPCLWWRDRGREQPNVFWLPVESCSCELRGGGVAGGVQLEALALCAACFPGKLPWGLGELWLGRLSLVHHSPGHEGGQENGVSSTPCMGGTRWRLGTPGDRGDDKACAPEECLHCGSKKTLVCARVNGQTHGEKRAVTNLFLSPPRNTSYSILPLTETCQRPVWWDPRLQMAPVHGNYKKNEEVTLSCDNGFQPSFTHVKCAGGAQSLNYSGSLNSNVWLGRKSSNAWVHIEGNIVCIGKQGVRRGLLRCPMVKSCPIHPSLSFQHHHCGLDALLMPDQGHSDLPETIVSMNSGTASSIPCLCRPQAKLIQGQSPPNKPCGVVMSRQTDVSPSLSLQ